jgi:hypothetical protein
MPPFQDFKLPFTRIRRALPCADDDKACSLFRTTTTQRQRIEIHCPAFAGSLFVYCFPQVADPRL